MFVVVPPKDVFTKANMWFWFCMWMTNPTYWRWYTCNSPNFKMSLFKRLLMNPRDVIFYFGNKMEISSSKEIYHSSFRKVWNYTSNDGFKSQKYVGSKLTNGTTHRLLIWNLPYLTNIRLCILFCIIPRLI